MFSNNGCSGLGGRRTCTDPEGCHQKTTSHQEEENVDLSLKVRYVVVTGQVKGETSSLEKGISLLFPLSCFFPLLNSFAAIVWIKSFLGKFQHLSESAWIILLGRPCHLHLRDLPTYPFHLEELRWAQPAINSPTNRSEACTDYWVCPTLKPPRLSVGLVSLHLLWPFSFDRAQTSFLLLFFSPAYLCWLACGSETWCCWRWSSPSRGGCVWPRGCGCCPGWQSCVEPSSFVWVYTLRQNCSVGLR